MLPKPPFVHDLSPEEELRKFAELQPQLNEVWDALMAKADLPYTAVIVPSLSLDQRELAKLRGAPFYEERLLFLLIRLRNPFARLVYVTSQPVHPTVLDYYLQFLAGVPATHARQRLTLLCAYDASPRCLSQKILERPRLLQRIRESIPDPKSAYLTVFNSTPLERRLAVMLGIPLNGLDPELSHLGTKSGSRKVFCEAGLMQPEGLEDLRTEVDLIRGLQELRKRRPEIRRAMVKLDDSFSGEGNAIYRYPEGSDSKSIGLALREMQFAVPEEHSGSFLEKFTEMGGICEEFVEGREKRSPSAQGRVDPSGDVLSISTHDQILAGVEGQVFVGCSFPAHDDYRMAVQRSGEEVGRVLASKGVVSRYGVDFLVVRDAPGASWRLLATEINLRIGGTTHPYLALLFLTSGRLDPETGLFRSPSGREKYYRATDNLRSDGYRTLTPDDLIEIVTMRKLSYSHNTESGVLFHLIGALSEHGKIGMTVIANSRDEVDRLYHETLEVLESEARIGIE